MKKSTVRYFSYTQDALDLQAQMRAKPELFATLSDSVKALVQRYASERVVNPWKGEKPLKTLRRYNRNVARFNRMKKTCRRYSGLWNTDDYGKYMDFCEILNDRLEGACKERFADTCA